MHLVTVTLTLCDHPPVLTGLHLVLVSPVTSGQCALPRRHSNGGQEKLGARTRALRFTETCHWCASLCSLYTSYCRVFIRYSAATYYNPLRILMMIWMSTQYCHIVSRTQACCGIYYPDHTLCPGPGPGPGLCVVVIFWVRSGYRNIWAQAVCPGVLAGFTRGPVF